MARGLRRYQCKGCGRTFNALSGTPLSGLHHKERWLSFGASLAKGETVKASAARCDVAASTAFRWRHRFLAAARSGSEVLKGIVEADETYVLESRKGARGLGRKARRREIVARRRRQYLGSRFVEKAADGCALVRLDLLARIGGRVAAIEVLALHGHIEATLGPGDKLGVGRLKPRKTGVQLWRPLLAIASRFMANRSLVAIVLSAVSCVIGRGFPGACIRAGT